MDEKKLKQAQSALSKGDPVRALTLAKEVLEHAPKDKRLGVGNVALDALQKLGQEAELLRMIGKLRKDFPKDAMLLFREAQVLRKQGDKTAALELITKAQENNPKHNAQIYLLQADILTELGNEDEAKACLETLVKLRPDFLWGHQRLALAAEKAKSHHESLAHFKAAAKIDETLLAMHFGCVRQHVALSDFEAALKYLETLREKFGPQPEIMLQLVRTCRRARLEGREEKYLTAALAAHPRDPSLLLHAFSTRAKSGDPEVLKKIVDFVRRKMGTDLADQLDLQRLSQTFEFEKLLEVIRQTPVAKRSPSEAQTLLVALFGAHRYRLGLRYLRFCLRRWPGNLGFWGSYVHHAPRLGYVEEVAGRLIEQGSVLPEADRIAFEFTICAYRQDLQGALARYELLAARGLARPPQRWVLHKMIFNLSNLDDIDSIYQRVGHPKDVEDKPLHRVGLPGMMAMELDLEREALAYVGGFDTVKEWVKERPGSSISSIRYIDQWRGSRLRRKRLDKAAIPARVFQYWDTPERPEAITTIMDSWARVEGVEHRVYDRRAARQYLKDNYDTSWVQAFNLAQDPTQEADFIRLCLLSREGGVWADADDFLYGDLHHLLKSGTGAIFYRESQGGALGSNFLAAPAGHPILLAAAEAARETLMQRASELAWLKTGPGLLTRVVGQFLVSLSEEERDASLSVLDWSEVARHVAMHCPVQYKTTPGYWNKKQSRKDTSKEELWTQLLLSQNATV